MPKPWDNREYQTIESVDFDGRLRVVFADGDEAVLEVDGLLARAPEKIDWSGARANGQEIVVPSADGPFEVSWLTLRSHSDPRFAEFLVEEADADARRIGRRLRTLRERRGMSAKEVAEAAGITPMSMSRIGLGRHDVVFRTLRRILAAMGYSLRDLAEVEEPALSSSEVADGLRNAGLPTRVVKQSASCPER